MRMKNLKAASRLKFCIFKKTLTPYQLGQYKKKLFTESECEYLYVVIAHNLQCTMIYSNYKRSWQNWQNLTEALNKMSEKRDDLFDYINTHSQWMLKTILEWYDDMIM